MGNAVPRRGSICNQRGEVIHYFCQLPIAKCSVHISVSCYIFFLQYMLGGLEDLTLVFMLFVLLLSVPSRQLWSWPDGQFT